MWNIHIIIDVYNQCFSIFSGFILCIHQHQVYHIEIVLSALHQSNWRFNHFEPVTNLCVPHLYIHTKAQPYTHTHTLTYSLISFIIESKKTVWLGTYVRHFFFIENTPKLNKNRQPGINGVGEYCGQYGLPQSERRYGFLFMFSLSHQIIMIKSILVNKKSNYVKIVLHFHFHFITGGSDSNKGKSKKWRKILQFPHISQCILLKDKIGEPQLNIHWIHIMFDFISSKFFVPFIY